MVKYNNHKTFNQGELYELLQSFYSKGCNLFTQSFLFAYYLFLQMPESARRAMNNPP